MDWEFNFNCDICKVDVVKGAKFTIESSAAAQVMLGAVGTSGSDINLSSLTIGAGDTVSISSMVYTASV